MLSKEKLYEGIKKLSEELDSSISSFSKNQTWKTAQELKELSGTLINLCKLTEKLGYEEDDGEDVKYISYSYKDEEVFTMIEAENWVKHLKTELPGGEVVYGEHWTLEQTTSVAKQKGIVWEHITPYCFWVTMNMIYSDYVKVAVKQGCDTLDFYVDMSKAFLFDIDSVPPKLKLTEYYYHIVKPAIKKK